MNLANKTLRRFLYSKHKGGTEQSNENQEDKEQEEQNENKE